jgi:hypothetical protein|uniref:Uncharacterized protein n=1 Tax=viral metagenome TaxID=1070528 RepID=A0A6C0JP48_9ZZZZ
MSKKVLIDAFFNQFTSFLGELKQMYPEDEDFPVFITTLSLMKTANPLLVVNFVKTEIVEPFGAKIQARDESFFLGQDYTTRNDVNLDIVEKIKQYIQGMSPETKETVWKYIEIITKLCLKALEA